MARLGSILAAVSCAFVATAAGATPQTPAPVRFEALLLPEPSVGLLILAALAFGFWRGREPAVRSRR